jgi:hypothetical protein
MRKKTTLKTIFLLITALSNQASAQVQVGTPATIFAANMNLDIEATDGTRTVIQKADGKMGLGTTSPLTLLHINSASSPAVRLVDGTQAADRVLTSDASGNASWKTTKVTLITGVLPVTGPTIVAATNDTWQIITGASIILPSGKWMVNMGSTAQLNVNNTTDGELWLQFAFNDNTSSFTGAGTADVITGLTGSKIVGGAGRGMILVSVNGCIALNNITGANKTYYVWGKKTQFNGSTTANWYDIMGSTNLERYFYALPIN